MSRPSNLDLLADDVGIHPSFRDLSGQIRQTSADTKRALLRANGIAPDSEAMIRETLAERRAESDARHFPTEIIVTQGEAVSIPSNDPLEWRLEIEDQPEIAADGRANGSIDLPPLPPGLHMLHVGSGRSAENVTLVSAPKSCPSIEDITGLSRLWGVNAALYAMQSTRNLGLGDFDDLARVCETVGGAGASFLGINPIHNIGWSDTETISPYSPSHRGFLNTDHIAIDRIERSSEGRRRSGLIEMIDYAGYRETQRQILTACYENFTSQPTHPEFEKFCGERGGALSQFALYEALSEVHGPDWRRWPEPLKAADAAVSQGDPKRIQFHKWLQWIADTQLADTSDRARQSGMALGLYLDLAVGARKGGAETWCEHESIAAGVAVGAPPDHLSPEGQNWQIAAYAPVKLAQTQYRAMRRTIAETMRHAGIMRIDHVLGMNRSFWIPDDGSPGGYITQPFDVLLAIVAIEAERSGTVVIGEDLGLVPEGFRDEINKRGLYSYSVLQYEKDNNGNFKDPAALRSKSLMCFGTHDTPTLKGFSGGRDIQWWQKLGWIDQAKRTEIEDERRSDVEALLGMPDAKPFGVDERSFPILSRRVHKAMATSPVAMISVQFDDLYGAVEAQNLPGTIDEHPNWRRASEVSVDQIGGLPGLQDVSLIMTESGRSQRIAESAEETK